MHAVKPHVLDASALMAYLEHRKGGDVVESLLMQFRAAQQSALMSVVNWGETYYGVWRRYGRVPADQALDIVARLPLLILNADPVTTKTAAAFKIRFNLPYADSFAAALAYIHSARLVASDPHFERVKTEIKLLRLS